MLNAIKWYLKHPRNIFVKLSIMHFLDWMSDELYLKLIWSKDEIGYPLDFKNPNSFNSKLQWLKINDRNPLYTFLVDKFTVKRYVSESIGEKYVIPVVGGPWESADDINFDSLPEKFVLKCNHDCGSAIICNDKKSLNYKKVKEKLRKSLKDNYYYHGREWPYKNVKPCIFAEKYVVDESKVELKDYKFFCFNGTPKCLFVASERMSRTEETKFDFFDMDYRHLDIINGHPNSKKQLKKPPHFEEMKELATKLSQGIPFVRVDFYDTDNGVLFGEMTFFHWGGMKRFDPIDWDYVLGEWIVIPE